MRRSASRLLWLVLMLGLLLAVLLTAVRLALPYTYLLKDDLADRMSQQLGFQVEIGHLQAELDGWNPRFLVTDLALNSLTPAQAQIALHTREIEFKLDLWQSLRARAPVFEFLHLNDTRMQLRERRGGWLPSAAEPSEVDAMLPLLSFLSQQPLISLNNLSLGLQPEQGELLLVTPIDARFETLDDEFQISGSMRLPMLGAPSQIQFALQGRDIPLTDPLQGDYAFYFSTEALGPELLQLLPLPVGITELSLQTEIWGGWRQGGMTPMIGNILLDRLALDLPDLPRIQKSGVQVVVLPQADLFQVQLHNLQLNSGGAAFRLPLLLAQLGWQSDSVGLQHIGIPELDLDALHHWLQFQPFLPPFLDDLLLTLAPEGWLRNLTVDWSEPGDLSSFRLDADLDQVGLSAWDEAPAASGINGRLQTTLNRGELYLQSEDFTLYFPELYPQGWRYSHASGVINWRVDEREVKVGSGLLRLSDEHVSGAGRFSMQVPLDSREQTELTLMIGMTGSDAMQTEHYTPPGEIGEELHAWLVEAIRAGHLNQGGLLIHGGTRRAADPSPMTVQLFFDIEDAGFAYQPGWPAVEQGDLFMHLHDDTLRIDIRSGRIRDTEIHSGWVYLPSGADRVHIAVQLEGPAEDLEFFLKQTPLRDEIGDPLAEWQLGGTLQTQLNLQIPISARGTPEVEAVAQLAGGRFSSDRQRLTLSDLNGELRFSTQRGLSAGRLEGQLFGERVRGSIETLDNRLGISLSGRIDPARMQEWTGISLLGLLTGSTDYHARLMICPDEPGCSRLDIQSLLQGVSVDLPEPFGKQPEQEQALNLSILLDRDELRLAYADQMQGVFDLNMPLRGHLHLGTDAVALPAGPGVVVDGRAEYLSEPVVRSLLTAIGGATDVGESHAVLSRLALRVDRFEARGVRLDALDLVLRPALGGGWQLQLAAPAITGQLAIPEQEGQVWRLELAHFALLEGMLLAQDEQAIAPLAPLQPADIPALDIHVSELFIGLRPYGEWRLRLRPEQDSVALRGIEGDLQDIRVKGEATWHTGSRSRTGLTLRIEGEDLGNLLERWEYGRALETETILSDLQLDWPGAPWDFSLAQVSGDLSMQALNGRVIESGNSANMLRLFGILNLNTLSRRLRFDFSDLVKRGVVFDQLSAHYRLADGVAHTQAPLRLEGPSAMMTLEGSLDLVNETLDKSIEVMLPVSSNLTLGAALLGAPHVAGALFIFDRITGGSLEKLTAIRYTLTGDWDDPQIQLITQEIDHAIGG